MDSIKVYVKSKEAFGWPDHPPEPVPLSKPSSSSGSQKVEGESSNVMPLFSNRKLTPVNRLVLVVVECGM